MKPDPDPYWKLRPPRPTPEDEICHCEGEPNLLLRGCFPYWNPLVCLTCGLEFPPERTGIGEKLAEQIYFWGLFHDSVWYLWIDSGEYESWAKTQLEDPGGPVNTRGVELVARLNGVRRTYFGWFRDTMEEDAAPPTRCPRCEGGLEVKGNCHVCEACSIVL